MHNVALRHFQCREPFLGVSSLNLAAPSGAAFFCGRFAGRPNGLTAALSGFNHGGLFKGNGTVKYGIDYKFLPKGSKELVEIGTEEDITIDDNGFGLLPNVGDYVAIPGNRVREGFRGKVHHRYFRYVFGICYVSIVLAEVDDAEWAAIGRP